MPKRAPGDAIHTTMTDHRIAARPKFTNPAEERHTPYTGQVVPFFGKADELSVALANVRDAGPDTVALYRRLLARAPGDAALRAALGKALLRLGDPSEALKELERALRLEPLQTDSRMYLGVALAMLGRHREALEQLRRAVRENPDHALAWTNLGVTLEVTGDRKGAVEAYTEAVRLQPDLSEARQRRSRLLTSPPASGTYR
jgi:Flp pilus assembly protein TadD